MLQDPSELLRLVVNEQFLKEKRRRALLHWLQEPALADRSSRLFDLQIRKWKRNGLSNAGRTYHLLRAEKDLDIGIPVMAYYNSFNKVEGMRFQSFGSEFEGIS